MTVPIPAKPMGAEKKTNAFEQKTPNVGRCSEKKKKNVVWKDGWLGATTKIPRCVFCSGSTKACTSQLFLGMSQGITSFGGLTPYPKQKRGIWRRVVLLSHPGIISRALKRRSKLMVSQVAGRAHGFAALPRGQKIRKPRGRNGGFGPKAGDSDAIDTMGEETAGPGRGSGKMFGGFLGFQVDLGSHHH